jgi:hypothetical protein
MFGDTRMYQVSEETAKQLLDIPESGMGYQIVMYHQKPLIVFHAVFAVDLKDFATTGVNNRNRRYLMGNPYADHFAKLEKLRFDEPPELIYSDFFPRHDSQAEIASLIGKAWTFRSSSTVSPIPKSRAKTLPANAYYRFSAYSIDRRRAVGTGDYLKGTYATTYNDIHHVPSGYSAVGRYALPNPLSARFVHPIVTFDQPTYTGTATPNFGQAGGGVEVFFGNGATARPDRSFPISDA